MQSRSRIEEILAKMSFSEELLVLHEILLSAGLEETVKWGLPVYTWNGQNIAGIGGFKSYFAVWFFQGALLSDPGKKLINAQEGKTKALRQWRMTSRKDIQVRVLKGFVKEAIQHTMEGRQIAKAKPVKKVTAMPDELSKALKSSKALKAAFDKLTPGRQKEYIEYIESAKRPETRLARLEKSKPSILAGKGLNDRYKK